jgi:ethanolamine kinase
MAKHLKHIDLYYDNANSHESALALILALRPEWQATQDTIDFVRFKDGITNTVRFRERVPKNGSYADDDDDIAV